MAATPREPSTGPWRVAHLFTSPHRLGFFAGALVLGASAAWWALCLLAAHFGWVLPWAVPAGAAHGVWMAFGYMPLFITGFWFTAGPRWLARPPVEARSLRWPVGGMLIGWALAVPGWHVSGWLSALGLAIGAAAWSAVCLRMVDMLRRSHLEDTVHARLVTAACSLGALAWWVAAAGAALADATLVRSAAWGALWLFAAPLFMVVSHRMIPFYGAGAPAWLEAWQPLGLVWVACAALWIEGLLALSVLWMWPLPRAVHALAALLLAPAAGLLLWLSVRWGLMQNLRIRLLAMLHGGFLWLGVALALATLSHARIAWMGPDAGLGLAPLHALTVGFLGSTLLAMATRVASAHSGRAVAADDVAWRLHLVLQLAAVSRVTAALWPAVGAVLTLVAVLAWCGAMGGWAWRYGGWLGRPRADGRGV